MISGKISVDDFLAAQRLHRRPVMRRLFIVLAVMFVLGVLMMTMGYFMLGAIFVGAGAGGFIGELFVSRFSRARKLRRIYRQQASFRASYTYSWDEESLKAESETGQGRRLWTDYIRIREDERMFLLYHSDVMFEMLPKSWFRDQDQVDAFRRLAEQGVGRVR